MTNPLETDPLFRQAVRDLHQTLSKIDRNFRLRREARARAQMARRQTFVPDRYWKNGKIVAQPYSDDR
jgi:hypothetical protein